MKWIPILKKVNSQRQQTNENKKRRYEQAKEKIEATRKENKSLIEKSNTSGASRRVGLSSPNAAERTMTEVVPFLRQEKRDHLTASVKRIVSTVKPNNKISCV